MALNLWKIGGKPSGYHPLPSGNFGASLQGGIDFMNNFVVSFTASSPTSQQIKVWVDTETSTDVKNQIQLTPTPTNYTITKKPLTKSTGLYIGSNSATSDIVLDNIVVSRVPLPKLTLNGFDDALWLQGSYNENWTTTVDAWYTSRLAQRVNALPNTTYTLNGNGVQVYVRQFRGGVQTSGGGWYSVPYTFTTGLIDQIGVLYAKGNPSDMNPISISDIDTVNPTINMGVAPIPYAKNTGTNMINPTPIKNLVPDNLLIWSLQNGATIVLDNTQTYNGYPVYKVTLPVSPGLARIVWQLPNTPSVLTASFAIKFTANNQAGNLTSQIRQQSFGTTYGNLNIPSNPNWQVITYTATGITDKPMLNFYQPSPGAPVTEFYLSMVQLEEGDMATSYAPYAVQLNKKPQRYVPKKNIIKNPTPYSGYYFDGSGGPSTADSRFIRIVDIPCKSNTTYTLSSNLSMYTTWFVNNGVPISKTGSNNISIGNGWSNGFTTPAGCNSLRVTLNNTSGIADTSALHWIQVEEGTIATPYEAYQAVLPAPKKGLVFSGKLQDYIQSPNVNYTNNCHLIADFMCPVGLLGNMMIVDQYTTGYGIAIFVDSNGKLAYRFGTAGSGTSLNNVNDGKKHRAEILVANGTITYMLDGAIVSTLTSQPGNTVQDSPISIGVRTSSGGQFAYIGEIYYVKFDDGVNTLFEYDFTNPHTLCGNYVVNNPINILPNFEDSRWVFVTSSGSVQVLGKDTLALIAPSSTYRASWIILPCLPNTRYLYTKDPTSDCTMYSAWYDAAGNRTSFGTFNAGGIVTTPSNAVQLEFRFDNGIKLGTSMLHRPQLIILSSQVTEGIVNGSPKMRYRDAHRVKYNIR